MDVEPSAGPPSPGRRRFLRRALLLGGAAGAGLGAARVLMLERFLPGHTEQAVWRPGPNNTTVALTPGDRFFVVSYGAGATVELAAWTLRVDGLVEEPQTFALDGLRALGERTQVSTIECVDNRPWRNLIGTAEWTGVPLRLVLSRARVRGDEARDIVFHCADGYTESHRVVDLMGDDILLAWNMNGVPLPRDHGFPLRLIMPDRWGYKQPKWIVRLEAVNHDYAGYWERRGWSDVGKRGGEEFIGRRLG
ncbi:MAG: molybdopterin-dependent oxidoreductase [Euryarchaeota archaeon]|nr:molybdopterin-dependent oxidoreductase [Euryarchaeota archaeon]